jgi:hypothetical protein
VFNIKLLNSSLDLGERAGTTLETAWWEAFSRTFLGRLLAAVAESVLPDPLREFFRFLSCHRSAVLSRGSHEKI